MGDEKRRVKLAVSLHSAIEETRRKLMPVTRKYDLTDLASAITHYYRKTDQRVTFEHIFFEGVNDTDREVEALVKFVRRIPCKVNVIPFHPIHFARPSGLGAELKPSRRMEDIVEYLRNSHLTVLVRSNAGEDIDAACGQLAVKTGRVRRAHTDRKSARHPRDVSRVTGQFPGFSEHS
jgi:23S rRNA (adenine2503-C2)-methyltransferase